MRLSAIVRSSLVHVVVAIAVLFNAARQLDAQVPVIRPAGSPITNIERVAANEQKRVGAFVDMTLWDVRAAADSSAALLLSKRAALSEDIAALALYAIYTPRQLFDAWRLRDAFPLAAARMREPRDSASRAVYYALAARNQASVDTLVKAAGADSATVRRNLQLLRGTLEDVLVRYSGGRRATLFAKGDVKGLATGGEPSAAATGALGLGMESDRATVQASLTLASTQDSLTTGFGASVLTPGSGKALSSGLLSAAILLPWWPTRPDGHVSALFPRSVHVYGTAASSRWQDSVALALQDGTPGPVQPVSANAVVLGGGALLQHELACCRVLDNPAVLTLEWGVGLRHVGGDITADRAELRAFRDSTLGTQRRTFWGPEVGMQLTVNRVIGSMQLYHLWKGGDRGVPGLTGFQLVTAFTIAADIFSGPLTR